MTYPTADSELGKAVLEHYPVPGAPTGFAARVLVAAQAAQAPKRTSFRTWAAVGFAVTAAAALLVVWLGRGGAVSTGERMAVGRETLRLAGRGVAVLEPGAEIHWRIGPSGAAIEQPQGDVFYRVEPGGSFMVKTPLGIVSVTGTSFRVEVAMKKRDAITGAAGAALATAVLVTVYEGRVLLANEHGQVALAAGESGTARRAEAPEALGAWEVGDARAANAREVATIKEALTQAQTKIAILEGQLQRAQKATQAGEPKATTTDDRNGDPARYYAPSKETLLEMAKECRLAYDRPPLDDQKAPVLVQPDDAASVGLSEAERIAVNDAYRALHDRVAAEIRQLYIELTGDTSGGDTLSLDAIEREIENKSSPLDLRAAWRQITRERAGLEPRPANPGQRSPAERHLRLRVNLGHQAEAAAISVVGPDRARALRALDGQAGWTNSVTDWSRDCEEAAE